MLSTSLFMVPSFLFLLNLQLQRLLDSFSLYCVLSEPEQKHECKAVFISVEQRRDEICFKAFQKVIVSPTFLSFSLFISPALELNFPCISLSFLRQKETQKAVTLSKTKYSRYAELLCLLFISFVLYALQESVKQITKNSVLFSNPLFIVIKVTKIQQNLKLQYFLFNKNRHVSS